MLSLGLIIKLAILTVVLVVIFVVVAGLYVAVVAGVDIPGLTGAFRTESEPPSAETVALASATERKIDEAVVDKSAFFLELTNEEVTALLRTRIDPDIPIRDVKVEIKPEQVDISGSLNGRVGVGFSGAVVIALELGQISLEVKDLSAVFIPLPGAAKDQLQPLLDEVLDLNELLSRAGATQIQSLVMEEGKATIVGVQAGGQNVSDVTLQALLNASGQLPPTPPTPPGENIVPPGRTGGEPGQELFLALGDSLAANVGVADPREGYVSRFHRYMEGQTGRTLGLSNIGISGESTISIVRGQLQQALDEINSRKNDGDPNTKVSVLTLDLGANDLIGHLGSAECQEDLSEVEATGGQATVGEACLARVEGALSSYENNFRNIVQQLDNALEDDAEFYIMTIYNPFDFGIGLPFEQASNEILEQMNDIIRETADSVGAKVAESYPLMQGRAAIWTNMLNGDIHPNATGFQVLAFSFAEAQQQ